jgi:hypothetical protein
MRNNERNKMFCVIKYKTNEEGMINLYDLYWSGEFIREMFMEPFEIPAAELADKFMYTICIK